MKTNHTLTDIEFNGTSSCGDLYYVLDGKEHEVSGEFYMDKNGVIHHEHWCDEEGTDVVEILCETRTYDVHFNDECDSNSKNFVAASYDYCKSYIESNNGTDESYFADYKGGTVSIVCNETGETLYEEEVR
jgi:hypothetical protein